MNLARRAIGIAGLLLAAVMPAAARAQSCSFSVSDMSFGQVDALSGVQTVSTATVSVNCSGTPLRDILICPNLGTGSGGATAAARQMLSGAGSLDYQLYSDSGRSEVWGSYFWPYSAHAPGLQLALGTLGTGSASATIHGTVFAGQGTVLPGSYLSTFASSHVEFRYRYAGSMNCNSGVGTIARPSFNVTAIVPADCRVAAENVDFGVQSGLGSNLDGTGRVSVTCTPGTAYAVGLNNGLAGTEPASRRMTRADQSVVYGLYKDAARSQPWGNSGAEQTTGAGTGAPQSVTVYGRVPPQATPSPGVYTDTVIVTVTY